MVEYAPSDQPGANKRRSARIVQAVPITVSGTDALGQSFKERTSTLIINCHGFKYQSKHYVLKGTAVEVEIPHPESGKEARRVRGSVTFVQRPRTVRELFQVGVELDTPGNVWGIAFPPEDWFPFTEEQLKGKAEEEAQAALEAKETPTLHVQVTALPKSTVPFPVPPPAPHPPKPALPEGLIAEVPMTVAKQWARMVAEAQQQMQRMAKDAASSAVSGEAATLLRELNAQMKEAAQKAVENAASTYADQVISKAVQRIEEMRRTSSQELRSGWEKEFEKDIRESSQTLQARLAEVGETFRQDFANRLRADAEVAIGRLMEMEQRMITLHKQVHSGASEVQGRASKLREEFDAIAEDARKRWSDQLISRTEENAARLAEMESSAQRIQAQIEAASLMAQEGWRAKIDEDVRHAQQSLELRIESLLSGAETNLAGRVERAAEDAREKLRAHSEEQLAGLRASADAATSGMEHRVASLQSELASQINRGDVFAHELESALRRANEQSLKLDMLAQTAADELNRRFEGLLSANSDIINKHVEALMVDLHAKLAPAMDAKGEEVMARTAADIERRITPEINRADALLQKLSSHEVRLDEALKGEKERLRAASDEYARRAIADIRGTVEQLQRTFDESCKGLLARFVEEAESKSNELSHTTFESMYKSAEWYQKKAQTAMQSALDKATAESVVHLREKAAELSGTFAKELAHYSRSYVEHTQEQIEEVAREGMLKARAELAQATESTGAQFSDEIHRLAEQKAGIFRESAASALRDSSSELSHRAADFTRDLLLHSEKMHAEFQQRLSERVQESLANAERDFHAHLKPVVAEWRAELQAHQSELIENLERLGAGSAEQYRTRLENASNSCIVAAVTNLNAQCQNVLESLAHTGEERVRAAFAQAIAGLGEALRKNLSSLSGEFLPPEKK